MTLEYATKFDHELTFKTIEALKHQKELDDRGVSGYSIIRAEEEVKECRKEWEKHGKLSLYRQIFSTVYGD